MINQNLLLTGDDGYNLTNSLRFRSSASAYLNRTFGTPTSTTTWSLSFWLKRGNLTANAQVFSAGGDFIYFGGGTFAIKAVSGAVLETTQVFRDPSAWYHFLVVADTSNATANNRVRLYVNGTEVTAFSSRTNPSLNAATIFNASSSNNRIGGTGSIEFYDGYLTEVNFIDGQALTPSSFGETSTSTGVWIPKKYSGTYGTNGFYLKFTDTTSTSTLGTDFSGNSNTWTVNNISLTAGTTYDSMTDVPTLTSTTTANYCVLSPLDYYSPYLNAPTEGNLKQSNTTGSAWGINRSTIGITSGKWYVEVTQTGSNLFAGVVSGSTSLTFPLFTGSSGLYAFFNNGAGTTGYPYANGTSGTVFTIASGDVIGLAYDYDAQTLAIYRNNSLQATVTSIPKTEPMFFCAAFAQTTATTSWNFGQRPFAYTPPTGFVRLNTFNLPTPTIGATASSQANKYFNAITYTGNGAASSNTTQNITTTFYPDLTWVKGRDSSFFHRLTSTGLTQPNYLSTNSTDAEGSVNDTISALASTYFQVKAAGTGGTNQSGSTYVGWTWNANSGSTVTNTAGTITSTVSANTTAGFSIVTYTGNNTSGATVGHGLGVKPSFIVVKKRTGTDGWGIYHTSLGATKTMELNTTGGEATSAIPWNNTEPTSSVIYLNGNNYANSSSFTYVMYCFAAVSGYSAFGSYTGNGSTDGTFVYTGFRPRFIMLKASSFSTASTVWTLFDTSRSPYNASVNELYANSSSAEGVDASGIDILSNGFKPRRNSDYANSSGQTYIYMAFAEHPFKYSLAR